MNADNRPTEQESPNRSLALGIAIAAGILAAVLRIVPHPPNFSSVGAVGLFGGAKLRAWQACLLSVGVMLVSDLALWILTSFDPLYSLMHLSRLYVYAAFMMYIVIGQCLPKRDSLPSVVLGATLGGVLFFIVTNFCTWLLQPIDPDYATLQDVYRYSRDWHGLVTCFMMALPFYNPGEMPLVDHPFMLFSDHRLAIFWTVLGDVFFTCLYMAIHAHLVRKAAPTLNPSIEVPT